MPTVLSISVSDVVVVGTPKVCPPVSLEKIESPYFPTVHVPAIVWTPSLARAPSAYARHIQHVPADTLIGVFFIVLNKLI